MNKKRHTVTFNLSIYPQRDILILCIITIYLKINYSDSHLDTIYLSIKSWHTDDTRGMLLTVTKVLRG